ncbi:MAG: hypothetical protein OEU92_14420 [Alphaproteobacteria bacterium]|nr:hypothetical protein [Alphaproteobacteria bacterium]
MQRSDAEKLVMVRVGDASGRALIGTSSGIVKQAETRLTKPAEMAILYRRALMTDLAAPVDSVVRTGLQ